MKLGNSFCNWHGLKLGLINADVKSPWHLVSVSWDLLFFRIIVYSLCYWTTHLWQWTLNLCLVVICEHRGILRSECDGTWWCMEGEVKGKLVNGVGSQYSHMTSKRGVSSTTNADVHTSAASGGLNWLPRRFKWTRPFRQKTKSGFCACAIRFRTSSTYGKWFNDQHVLYGAIKWLEVWLVCWLESVAVVIYQKVVSYTRQLAAINCITWACFC